MTAENLVKSSTWTFLTNHAHVLLCLAQEPDARVRDVAAKVGITERSAQRILGELIEEGYVTAIKEGRRNHYTVNKEAGFKHPLEDGLSIIQFLLHLHSED